MIRIVAGRHVKRQDGQTLVGVPVALLTKEDLDLLERELAAGRAGIEWRSNPALRYNAVVELFWVSGHESSFCEVEAREVSDETDGVSG